MLVTINQILFLRSKSTLRFPWKKGLMLEKQQWVKRGSRETTVHLVIPQIIECRALSEFENMEGCCGDYYLANKTCSKCYLPNACLVLFMG